MFRNSSPPEYRNPVREHEEAEEVFGLFLAKCPDLRWRALVPFVSAVPTVIRVHAILIGEAILPVVFVVIRKRTDRREAIVAIDVVHGLEGVIGMLAAVRKQVIAAVIRRIRSGTIPALPSKTADIVAITCVPLQPGRARKTMSEPIAADVPWSAINASRPNSGSAAISLNIGASPQFRIRLRRVKTRCQSKRKPSMCISFFQ